jgi:predicted MPP superfamily phosphohydrolase
MGRWPARLATQLGTPLAVEVERHDIHVETPLGRANSLRVAFASDFHAGANTPEGLIAAAVEWLTGADVDLVLLGGDFVSLRLEAMADLARMLAEVPARLGKYAVLGNHDHWTGGPEVVRYLESAGVTMLTNRNVRLPDPFGNVSICGLDDHTTGEPDARSAFSGAESTRLVLMHAPSNLLDVGDHPFAVAICGHTHGGQIALANGRPLKVAHGRLSRRYNAGRFSLDNGRVLLVSRGIGYSTIPIRTNAPPSVMICTLHGRPHSHQP